MAMIFKESTGLDFDWGAVDASKPLRGVLSGINKAAIEKDIRAEAQAERDKLFAFNVAKAEVADEFALKSFNEQVLARQSGDTHNAAMLTKQTEQMRLDAEHKATVLDYKEAGEIRDITHKKAVLEKPDEKLEYQKLQDKQRADTKALSKKYINKLSKPGTTQADVDFAKAALVKAGDPVSLAVESTLLEKLREKRDLTVAETTEAIETANLKIDSPHADISQPAMDTYIKNNSIIKRPPAEVDYIREQYDIAQKLTGAGIMSSLRPNAEKLGRNDLFNYTEGSKAEKLINYTRDYYTNAIEAATGARKRELQEALTLYESSIVEQTSRSAIKEYNDLLKANLSKKTLW